MLVKVYDASNSSEREGEFGPSPHMLWHMRKPLCDNPTSCLHYTSVYVCDFAYA